MVLDEVIVISDDEGSSQPCRPKRHKSESAGIPTKASGSIDVWDLSNVVNITDEDSDVEFVDVDPPGGPTTIDKGKGIAQCPQQPSLWDRHAVAAASASSKPRSERDGLQQQLTASTTDLPLNLPEQLKQFHCLVASSASDNAPVIRRDLLELCGTAETRRVERLIYKAASRAVNAQLDADGSVRKPQTPKLAEEPQSIHVDTGYAEESLSPGSKATRAARHHRTNRQDVPTPDPRQAGRGKRKAGQEESRAQQPKHAQHVLKRKERVQSCPSCCAAQIMACDKLDTLPVAQLKLIMGSRGLRPGTSHEACCDGLAEACKGLSHICLLCHASLCSKTGDIRLLTLGDGAGPSVVDEATAVEPDPRWLDGAVQQCLKLCSNVDLVYKLLIQDIHPVLEEAACLSAEAMPGVPPAEAMPGVQGRGGRGGQGRGGGRAGRGRGAPSFPGVPGASWPMALPPMYTSWGVNPGGYPDDMFPEVNFDWGGQDGSASTSSRGWAKGTGYGGGGSYHHPGQSAQAEKRSRDAASARQQVTDEHIQRSITAISNCVETTTGQEYGSLLPTCPPLGVSAILHGGPFAASLRLLLQNDSIMEIGAHARTYGELLRLLNLLGSSVDLAPLLYQPADFEEEGASASPGGSDKAAQTPSVLDALHKLSQQCHVFKKSAEHLASGSNEDIGALSLALQIIDADQELQESMAQLKKLTASDNTHAQTAAGAATPAKGPSEGPSPASEKRLKGKQLAAANAAAEAAAKAAETKALHARYIEALQPHSFTEYDLMSPQAGYYFRNQALASKSGGGEVMRKWLRRVSEQHASLSASLPVAWASSVFVATDPSRLDVLRALIIGPADTPYANGCFLFDIFLPTNYPDVPPMVQYLTTGGGRVRFNPNLYENGKVCLSLLGTWAGPSWDPAQSTILQVLISIQSMILVNDPYYNEPGFESSRGTTSGNQECESYNQQQQCNTVSHSILAALAKPDPCFGDVIRTHYSLKKEEVQQQLQEWLLSVDRRTKQPMIAAVKSVQAELQKLSVA